MSAQCCLHTPVESTWLFCVHQNVPVRQRSHILLHLKEAANSNSRSYTAHQIWLFGIPLGSEGATGNRTSSRLRMAISEDARTRSCRSARSSGDSLCMSPKVSGVALTFSSRKSIICRPTLHALSRILQQLIHMVPDIAPSH